ncbi:hypothetical protein ASPACDRAFT_112218 [Aspergillus aculeatus ATCC 16872]|uniref:Uncharacterized protein n=1 Tax=Aspergillus aculeatus (strain ATCC 16872 / CBS 172.66 / WB 5094) TaxID=690307 RepID=A0A1L9X685_ASPA1|nr:uncharacterized protein ASPACDRAFT_112218 [Aspergillus aculeatus ATCC 16872]OJK03986.1 hypothetical protein ASPACDRAFT_112218 [Aspergillus aculeatus ATCC 16872]
MSATDSDTESTVSSQSRPTTAKTAKSQSQQVFPFAHPPPKSTSCFRFTSRLLLQIQQLLSASRALPILEIYRPSSLGKSIPGCPSKVHSQDLYIVQSDAYQNLPASCSQSPSTDSPVVGVIYTNYCSSSKTTSAATSSSSSTDNKPATSPSSSSSTSPTTKSPPNNSNNNHAIYLPQLQLTLLASRTSRGGYIFQFLPSSSSSSPTTPQKLTLELAKRKPKHKNPPPRSSATTRTHRSSASTTPDDDDEEDNLEPKNHDPASFLLGIRGTTSTPSTSPVDPNSGDSTRRSPRPWLAGLSHKGIKLPRGEQEDQLRRRVLAAVGVGEERVDVLYTITLLVGIYAARMEGWV